MKFLDLLFVPNKSQPPSAKDTIIVITATLVVAILMFLVVRGIT